MRTTAKIADFDKIKGLQSEAIDIDKAVEGDFRNTNKVETKNIHSETLREDISDGIEIHFFSDQLGESEEAGTQESARAIKVHNYTDGGCAKFDNVGAGEIIYLKNAQNPFHRSDKPEDFVGSGDFIRMEGYVLGGTDESFVDNILRIRSNGDFVFNGRGLSAKFIQSKPDGLDSSGSYAFEFMMDYDHYYFVNFDNKIKFYVLDSSRIAQRYDRDALMQVKGVTTMKLTDTSVEIYNELKLYNGIQDKNGSTGTLGQVLTANGDGTCEWK